MKEEGLRMTKATKKPIRVIEPDDLATIFSVAEGLEGWTGSVARGMLSIYFSTGLRPTELRLAHVGDLNLRKRTIFVRHPKGEGNWASPEDVNMIRGDMVPLVEQYLRERESYLHKMDVPDAEYLFPNLWRKEGFYSANGFRAIKRKVVKATGVDFNLKDFRSTLTTITVNDDLSRVPAMSVQLRHASIGTTQIFYARIERSVASKKLKDYWRETPVIASKSPSIDSRFELSGYGCGGSVRI